MLDLAEIAVVRLDRGVELCKRIQRGHDDSVGSEKVHLTSCIVVEVVGHQEGVPLVTEIPLDTILDVLQSQIVCWTVRPVLKLLSILKGLICFFTYDQSYASGILGSLTHLLTHFAEKLIHLDGAVRNFSVAQLVGSRDIECLDNVSVLILDGAKQC